MSSLRIKKTGKRFGNALRISLGTAAIVWIVHIINRVLDMSIVPFGIIPRDSDGLLGIFTSPFVHSLDGWTHILNNTPPLLVSMVIIYFFYKNVALRTYLGIYLFTGLAVWIFARGDTSHVGASGVIYGYVSFIFFSGLFRLNVRSIVLALIVLFLYSGMIAGVFPTEEGISWESHLLGGIVGAIMAYLLRHKIEKGELKSYETEDWKQGTIEEPKHFFDSDIFDKTRAEREKEKKNDDWWWSNNT